MMERGIRQVDIARRLRVTRGMVSAVLNGHSMSARVRRAIARALGMRVADLWPGDRSKAA